MFATDVFVRREWVRRSRFQFSLVELVFENVVYAFVGADASSIGAVTGSFSRDPGPTQCSPHLDCAGRGSRSLENLLARPSTPRQVR